MQRLIVITLVLLSSAVPASAETLRLDRAAVVDAQGFGQPVIAGTLFIPHGWQAQGGIEWGNQHACVNGYAINWMAQAPDASRGMAALPQQRWEWNARGTPGKLGCAIARIDNAETYLRAVFAQLQNNSGRVVGFQNRPDLVQQFAGATGVQGNDFQQTETSVSAGQIDVTFTAENGDAMTGSLIAALQITHIRTGGGMYGPVIDSWAAFAVPTFVSWGKAGHYDSRTFEALRKSYVENPAWTQRIAQHNQRMGQINREGIAKRAAIWNQANQDINQIINDTWQNQQQSSDYRAREFLEYLRDTETYQDTTAPGGTVELSSAYNQAWKLADGTYVLTDDPSFTPEAVFSMSGEQLTAAP